MVVNGTLMEDTRATETRSPASGRLPVTRPTLLPADRKRRSDAARTRALQRERTNADRAPSAPKAERADAQHDLFTTPPPRSRLARSRHHTLATRLVSDQTISL